MVMRLRDGDDGGDDSDGGAPDDGDMVMTVTMMTTMAVMTSRMMEAMHAESALRTCSRAGSERAPRMHACRFGAREN